MDSTFNFSIRRLPNGDALLCDGSGVPIACNSQGRILVNRTGQPMNVDQANASRGSRSAQKEEKVDLADYSRLVGSILSPRLNLRTAQIECNGIPISEEEFEHLNVRLVEDQGLKFKKGDLQSTVRALARKAEYDPVKQWLDGLGSEETGVLSDDEWSRIAELALGQADEWSQTRLQKWLIACVARVYEPGCQADYALILHGGQGAAKSTFFRELGGEYFTDSLGDLRHNKDDLMILHKHWICEWSEADQIFVGAHQAEKIKRFVSGRDDTFRSPYGRTCQTFKRRSVIVGTTNRDDWAKDPTGNRRFPVISVTATDAEWIRQNRDRIWGRAAVEFRRGSQWWFTKEEEARISQEAAAYAPEDPNAERMLQQLKAHPGRWFSTHELVALALEWDKDRIDQRSLASAQRSLNALSTQGVVSDRKYHEPLNASHGGKGTKRVWSFPVNSTQPTQS